MVADQDEYLKDEQLGAVDVVAVVTIVVEGTMIGMSLGSTVGPSMFIPHINLIMNNGLTYPRTFRGNLYKCKATTGITRDQGTMITPHGKAKGTNDQIMHHNIRSPKLAPTTQQFWGLYTSYRLTHRQHYHLLHLQGNLMCHRLRRNHLLAMK